MISHTSTPALVARLANSVHILEEAVKNGGDGSLEETLPGDPEALRGPSPPPPAPVPPVPPVPAVNPPGAPLNPKETVKDTDTQSIPDAQMRDRTKTSEIMALPDYAPLLPGKQRKDGYYHDITCVDRHLSDRVSQ